MIIKLFKETYSASAREIKDRKDLVLHSLALNAFAKGIEAAIVYGIEEGIDIKAMRKRFLRGRHCLQKLEKSLDERLDTIDWVVGQFGFAAIFCVFPRPAEIGKRHEKI